VVHFQINRLHGYEPGEHTIEYWAVDAVGNVEDHHVEVYVLDTRGPTTSISFGGICEVTVTAQYQITPMTLIMFDAVDDGCGVANIYYRIDDGDWVTYVAPFVVSEEGEYGVYYYATDLMGNAGGLVYKSIQVGGGEPVTTCQLSPGEPTGENGWYIGPVTVTLTAYDEVSGVDYTMYRVDKGTWQIYTEPFVFDVDGVHSIRFYSVDKVGNIEDIGEEQISLDIYGPQITVSKPTSYLYIFDRAIMPLLGGKPVVFGRLTVEAVVEDIATSGVESTELYVDDILKGTFSENVEYTIDETLFGSHVIRIVAYDVAGNKTVKEIRATIYNFNLKK